MVMAVHKSVGTQGRLAVLDTGRLTARTSELERGKSEPGELEQELPVAEAVARCWLDSCYVATRRGRLQKKRSDAR